LPGTAVVAAPFVAPLVVAPFVIAVEAAGAFLVADWLLAAELGVPGVPFVAGDDLVFAGVGVAVGLFAAAGWPAAVGLLAPVFCAVATVAMAAASPRI
jgi:hypothetical protein